MPLRQERVEREREESHATHTCLCLSTLASNRRAALGGKGGAIMETAGACFAFEVAGLGVCGLHQKVRASALLTRTISATSAAPLSVLLHQGHQPARTGRSHGQYVRFLACFEKGLRISNRRQIRAPEGLLWRSAALQLLC